mgnify:CR=1 FL=1
MAIATNDTNTKEKAANFLEEIIQESIACLLYTSPSPRD